MLWVRHTRSSQHYRLAVVYQASDYLRRDAHRGCGVNKVCTNQSMAESMKRTASSLSTSAKQASAQKENRVSISPHLSPTKEPSGCCRPVIYVATESFTSGRIASSVVKIWTALSVYRRWASSNGAALYPPLSFLHVSTHATIFDVSSWSLQRGARHGNQIHSACHTWSAH